ncbi:helix-turn-helix domain-containing protein [Kriegella aquimaris]|uniref:TolB amino-terminal domain-containing protein n=1 Tax=Kriegella aquimaris TaxID=192904 RepID=A0A1G9PPG4_9FLAO|nr:helix-turn-helix domain-containing protein [Kriegella aquimaris]SDM00670.1 TolB amino-terminal domain-containing protein [Kriegella aquimaris]
MGKGDSLPIVAKSKSSQIALVDKLSKEIEANLNNDQFGVDSLARSIGMSRSSLHRKLHKTLGISTSQFIREYRLKRALEILIQEEATASEVAYRVGFSSATYFSTSFHKFYGYTPGEVKSKSADEIMNRKEPPSRETRQGILSHDDISKKQKVNFKKIVRWSVLLIAVASTATFIYHTTSEENINTIEAGNIIDVKSIAVLPFKNWTGDPNLEYISDGMTDAVISRLTKIKSIDKVIPFTSTIKFKETNRSTKEIADELGVDNLLQGNLQISGNQVKINLQLINGNSNEHIWSEEYTRDWKTDEIFKMQTEVVEGIATNMNAVIADNELEIIQKIPTKSKQAYSYYLQADFQRNKGNELSYSNAIALYKKAIALDSNFVQPYLDIANIYNLGGGVWGLYDERTAWKNAKVLLEKVLKIEPENRQAEEEFHTGSFFYDWNFELVEKYYQNILTNSFYDKSPVISLDYAIKTGRPKETLKAVENLILIDPSSVFFPFFKAEALLFSGSKSEAIKALNNSDALYSDNWFYLRESAKLYFYLDEFDKSKIQLEKILAQFSDYPPILMWLKAVYEQMDGGSKTTNKYLGQLFEEYNKGSSGSPAWFLALFYCTQKNYEKTFEWLQKSYKRHEVEMTWLREEPLLAPLRNDPRYKELYEKVGFSRIGLPIKTSSKIYASK